MPHTKNIKRTLAAWRQHWPKLTGVSIALVVALGVVIAASTFAAPVKKKGSLAQQHPVTHQGKPAAPRTVHKASPKPSPSFNPNSIPYENPPAAVVNQKIPTDNRPDPNGAASASGLHLPTLPSKPTPQRVAGEYWPTCDHGRDIQVRRYKGPDNSTLAYAYKGAGLVTSRNSSDYCKIWVNETTVKKYVGWGTPGYCSLLVHEAGHLAGYGHSKDPNSIMYPTLEAPTYRRLIPKVCRVFFVA